MIQTRSVKATTVLGTSPTRSGRVTSLPPATTRHTRFGKTAIPPKFTTLPASVSETMGPLIVIDHVTSTSIATIEHLATKNENHASVPLPHATTSFQPSGTALDSESVNIATYMPTDLDSRIVPTIFNTLEPPMSFIDTAANNAPATTSPYTTIIVEFVPNACGSATKPLATKNTTDDEKVPASTETLEIASQVPASLMARTEAMQHSKAGITVKRKRRSSTMNLDTPEKLMIIDNVMDDISACYSTKQALKLRQRAFEDFKSIIDNLDSEVLRTTDSDLTGDYGSMHLWERRSVGKVASGLLDESAQLKLHVQELLDELEEYQETLRRIKDFYQQ